ncbi:MAG: endonuclease NucS [candidate division Zixibacteria bacterium]|nr:endonuclease NucS [candidate division Zixibacteria bacterium]
MPQDIKIWEVDKNELKEINKKKLDLEERLEGWIAKDISLVADDLLIIGRQVETNFGGVIDLLCLDADGDIVILELKRDKTPRDITAQLLDYASWVKDLSNKEISEIAHDYLKNNGPIENAYKDKFGDDIPEVLNENHKMLIIASIIDPGSERIIEYLSDSYGIGINAVTFQYYEDLKNKKEFLSKVFLVEPNEADYRIQSKSSSKRKPLTTFKEFEKLAQENGVEDIYDTIMSEAGLCNHFDKIVNGVNNVSFIKVKKEKTKTGHNKSQTIFNIYLRVSNSKDGLYYEIYLDRFIAYFKYSKDEIKKVLHSYEKDDPSSGEEIGEGYFKNKEEAIEFIALLNKTKK